MPEPEKKKQRSLVPDDFFTGLSLAEKAEVDVATVVDTPAGGAIAETEDGVKALAKELGSRFVNTVQMGRTGAAVGGGIGGLLGGPPGAAAGGAMGAGAGGIYGFTMEPSGNELSSDLPATLVEMLFPAAGKALSAGKYTPVKTIGNMMRSGLGQAAGVGGAVATVDGRGDQILFQVGGNMVGQAGNRFVRTFQSTKGTDIGQIRGSSSSASGPLEAMRQLTADEAIKMARANGFDIPAGGLQEIGRPDLQKEVLQLVRSTGGGTGRVGQFASSQDEALTKMAETGFGIPSPQIVETAFKTMLDLNQTVTKTGNVNFRFGNQLVATMSPNQAKMFQQIAGEGKSFADLGKRLIKPGSGGLEGIEQIQLVRKVAKNIDPGFDAAIKRDMFEALWGKSQLQLAGEGFAKTDVTQGGKFLQMITKMDPAKLEAAFDKDGAEALMLLAKVANAIDPSTVFAKGTDLAPASFLLNKMGFTAASSVLGMGAAGAATSFSGEEKPSVPEILLRTGAGAAAGLGMFIGLGNLASRAITNPTLAKALNQMSDSAGKAESGVRAIITDAIASGNVAIDEETGKMILYPYVDRGEEEKEPNPIQQMMLQGNML